MTTLRLLCTLLVAVTWLAAPATSDAQIWKRLKERAEEKIEKKLGEKQDKAIDRAFEGSEGDSTGTNATPPQTGAVPENAGPAGAGAPGADDPSTLTPGEGAWANYDFVPGERVLFYDDLANEYTGNFPGRLTFASGSMEVVEWEGRKLLRVNSDGEFRIALPETLPERFTLAFDAYPDSEWHRLFVTTEQAAGASDPGALQYDATAHFLRVSGEYGTGVTAAEDSGKPTSIRKDEALPEGLFTVRAAFDGPYVKMYLNERRVANIPNADVPRDRVLRFLTVLDAAGGALYLGNFRVAAGGRAILYDRLRADGRVAAGGLLFDTGSARLRPESTPTLEEIGHMLRDHPDLRLRIAGHTDDTGSADANRRLSQERAASVRTFLIEHYDVAPDRLEAVGLGPSQPVAPNDTPEGRQTNRRVELVRLD